MIRATFKACVVAALWLVLMSGFQAAMAVMYPAVDFKTLSIRSLATMAAILAGVVAIVFRAGQAVSKGAFEPFSWPGMFLLAVAVVVAFLTYSNELNLAAAYGTAVGIVLFSMVGVFASRRRALRRQRSAH